MSAERSLFGVWLFCERDVPSYYTIIEYETSDFAECSEHEEAVDPAQWVFAHIRPIVDNDVFSRFPAFSRLM